MNSIVISEAKPEDAAGIRKVQRDTWMCTYPNEKLGITPKDVEEKVDEMQTGGIERLVERIKDDKNSRTYVAKDGDQIVGFVGAQKTEEINRLRAIYVLSSYHGQGIGRSLLEKALEFLGEEKDISLEVVEYNTKAIEFYKKNGFKEKGPISTAISQLPSGKEFPEIEMIKSFV